MTRTRLFFNTILLREEPKLNIPRWTKRYAQLFELKNRKHLYNFLIKNNKLLIQRENKEGLIKVYKKPGRC